jgi:hypothetical protein
MLLSSLLVTHLPVSKQNMTPARHCPQIELWPSCQRLVLLLLACWPAELGVTRRLSLIQCFATINDS